MHYKPNRKKKHYRPEMINALSESKTTSTIECCLSKYQSYLEQ